MKSPLLTRTVVTALLVVIASSATGIGIGRLVLRVARADDKPGAASGRPNRAPGGVARRARANARSGMALNPRGGMALGGLGPADQFPDTGLRVIYPNPRDLFPDRFAGGEASVFAPNGAVTDALTTTTGLPMFNYSITATKDGLPYSGTIMGRDPTARGKTTTTIPTLIVPLVITINDGATTHMYDPTANDPCLNSKGTSPPYSPSGVLSGSPLFSNNNWVFNGVNVGNTQYNDAFQRAQFWQYVGGTSYHLILAPSTLPAQALSFGSTVAQNYDASQFGGCGTVGIVDNATFDNAIRNLIAGPLAGMVNAGTFPIFLTSNVYTAAPGHNILANCCILGYHSFTPGSNPVQVYSPFGFDSSGIFGAGAADVTVLSHELNEAINDPLANNGTPAWGGIGQQGGCQGNFETGDPLTGTVLPAIAGANGFTYHVQELAFFSWFYNNTSTPSLGVGGKFSNNGTFGGPSKPCPTGGTN